MIPATARNSFAPSSGPGRSKAIYRTRKRYDYWPAISRLNLELSFCEPERSWLLVLKSCDTWNFWRCFLHLLLRMILFGKAHRDLITTEFRTLRHAYVAADRRVCRCRDE